MKNYELVLKGFEEKAKLIIHKYAHTNTTEPVKYGYLRLAGFFGSFNTTLLEVDAELHEESSGILKNYINNDYVDFANLVDGLFEHKNKAKLEFIRIQQPPAFKG